MKRYRAMSCAAVAALVMTAYSTAEAQDRGKLQLEARGGVAVPTGELADALDPGATFGAKIAYMITPRVGLRADGDVAMLRGTDLADVDGGIFDGPDLTFIHYTGGLQVDVSPEVSRWSLLINGGAGATTIDSDAFQDADDPTLIDDFNETYFTANGGLHVGYDVTESVNAFLGAQAYVIFADEEDTQVFSQLSPEASAFETAVNVPIHVGFMVSIP